VVGVQFGIRALLVRTSSVYPLSQRATRLRLCFLAGAQGFCPAGCNSDNHKRNRAASPAPRRESVIRHSRQRQSSSVVRISDWEVPKK